MTLTDVPVQLANKASTARDGIVTLGVRLAPGELSNRATQLRVVDGALEHRLQWEPFHDTRHPDGSFRNIAVHFPATMAALEERQVTLSEGIAASQPAFALHAAVSAAQAGTTFALTVEGETRTITLAEVLAAPLDATPFAVGSVGVESTAHKRRHLLRRRWTNVTNQRLRAIWMQVVVEAPSAKTRAKLYFRWGYSWCQSGVRLGNPWNDKTMVLTQPARLTITGPGVFFHGENKKFNAISRVGNVSTFTLVDPDRFTPPETAYPYRHRNLTQGMAHEIGGELLFGGEAIPTTDLDREGISATAMDWPVKGMPPFGHVPELPPYITTRAEAITRLREWELSLYSRGRDIDPYFWSGTISNANTGGTGDVDIGFGITRLWLTMRTGYPAALGVLLRDIRQEFCRPNHNRYPADDAPLWRYQDFRPAVGLQLSMFNGVPFHQSESNHSEEMFGVNAPVGQLGIYFEGDCPESMSNGAIGGWDRQHGMMMVPAIVAQITADFSALSLFEAYEQVWLGNCDPENPNETVNENEESRAFARGIGRAGLDIWTITGTQRIIDILRTRLRYALNGTPNGGIDKAYQHSPARPGVNFPNTMGGFDDRGPGAQSGSLETVNHCYPWQDAQITGTADALAQELTRLYGPTDQIALFARYIAADLALQATNYGWVDMRGLAPDRYRYLVTNVSVADMSQAGVRDLVAGRTVTGGTSGATAVVVSWLETDGTAALWVKDASGAFCPGGAAEGLTFTGSAFTCQATEDVPGFTSAKARWNTADYHALTKTELEETVSFGVRQPTAPGQLTALLGCTKEVNPIVDLTPSPDPHYLVATSRLRIQNDPWPALNGEWSVTIVDNQRARLMGCDTTAMPGTYVPSAATVVDRLLWGSRAIKLYRGYGKWMLQAAILAREAAVNGVYGPLNTGTIAERTLLRAQAIIDEFGAGRIADVPATPIPRWNKVDEDAAVRATPFGGTPQAPTAPINLAARGTSTTAVLLTWQNTASNATRIEVQWRFATTGAWESAPDAGAAATSATVTGLATNTDFEFRVRAVNDVGPSPWSNVAAARTQGAPPAPPTNLNSTGSTSQSIDLAWSLPPTNNADNLELDMRQVGAGTWTTLPLLPPTQTTNVVTGLAQGTDYEFRLRALNGFGASAYAGPITASTLGGAPLPPNSLVAGSPTTTAIGLTWALAGGGPAATAIDIQFRLTGATAWSDAPAAAGNATSSTVSGLTVSQAYDFRIRATNGAGSSVWVGPASATTLPTAPASPTVTPESAASLVFAWTLTVANATSNELEYRQVGAPGWTSTPALAGNATAMTVSGLLASTAYEFRIRSVNAGGPSAWSATAQGTTLANTPTAPTGLAVASISSSQLRPSWTNTAVNATSLEVEFRRVGTATWNTITGLDPGTTQTTIGQLLAGTAYEVRVRARNGSGPSPYAGPVQATTQVGAPAKISPDAPINLRVISVYDTIEVFWSIVATNHFGHEVQIREVNTIPWKPAGLVSGNQASMEITAGISRGKGYELRVRAFHDEAESGWLGPMAVSVGSTSSGAASAVLLEIVGAHVNARRGKGHVHSQSIAGRALEWMSMPDLLQLQRELLADVQRESSGPIGVVPIIMERMV